MVNPGGVECDDCFDGGNAHVVAIEHNFAVNGAHGFDLLSTGATRDNIATNNSQYGFSITNVPTFQGNTAVGERRTRVVVVPFPAKRPLHTHDSFRERQLLLW